MNKFTYYEDSEIRSGNNYKEKKSTVAKKMDAPLSAYWVKFFKSAGFPSEVATKHAVIFSNNRIQPDMLPDLDKPSLKDMGINLIGDIIAILRYAKMVVEENSCKKIMISTNESQTLGNKSAPKPNVKKIAPRTQIKPPGASSQTKAKIQVPVSSMKTIPSTKTTIMAPTKKLNSVQVSRMYSDFIPTNQRQKNIPLKRKFDDYEEEEEEEEGINGKWIHNETVKRFKNNINNSGYKMPMPKEPLNMRSQKILKKALEQKRAIFNRLGDSMVSSTTNFDFSNNKVSPTFTVTGVGKNVYNNKKNSSVFNRLGNKDNQSIDLKFNKNSRNEIASSTTHGILKTRVPLLGTKVIASDKTGRKKIGTMRADEEAFKKRTKPNTKSNQSKVNAIVKNNSFKSNFFKNNSTRNNIIKNNSLGRKVPNFGKLASDKIELPAKSRLGGGNKQVTFNKLAMINHTTGVFSRLGI